VRFVTNTADLAAGEQAVVDEVARDLRALMAAAEEQGVGVSVVAVGHTDSSGNETTNTPLSDERARRMVDALRDRGIPASIIATRGVATSNPVRPEATPEDAAFNRSVTFEVTVDERE
jgi:outer membrane protein OmpA-like peptidoglycan-associated protein